MDDIVREGARRIPAAALEAEVNQYIADLAGERDEAGRRLVVRNGHHRERTVTTAAGPIAVKTPRVNDKRVDGETGERKRFSSKFLGSAAGLSRATVTRLTKQWSDDHAAFQDRDLSGSDYVYVWADGVHPKVRLGQARSCVMVLTGVRTDGSKELIALAEGMREYVRGRAGPAAGRGACARPAPAACRLSGWSGGSGGLRSAGRRPGWGRRR
jgi:transposase-like protein